MKSVAIMQPYLFPYIGYFQLIDKCSVFVLYDDVSYIKGGFINRNSISDGRKVMRFTVPVPGSSSNVAIRDLSFNFHSSKLLKNIEHCYKKAPYYSAGVKLVEKVINYSKIDPTIAGVSCFALRLISDLIGLNVDYVLSSHLPYDRELNRSEKLIQIVGSRQGSTYVNLVGGSFLYRKKFFDRKGIKLLFLEPQIVPYEQFSGKFYSNLSILDFIMHLPPELILRHCQMGKLV